MTAAEAPAALCPRALPKLRDQTLRFLAYSVAPTYSP